MSHQNPFVAKDKSFVGKKTFFMDAAHPVMLGGQIDKGETFPFLAGTVMAKLTTGGNFCRYEDTRLDGGAVAVGVLTEQVDAVMVNSAKVDINCAIAVHGVALRAQMVGLDANAEADLKGAVIFV